jgi:hypothetical protein
MLTLLIDDYAFSNSIGQRQIRINLKEALSPPIASVKNTRDNVCRTDLSGGRRSKKAIAFNV